MGTLLDFHNLNFKIIALFDAKKLVHIVTVEFQMANLGFSYYLGEGKLKRKASFESR